MLIINNLKSDYYMQKGNNICQLIKNYYFDTDMLFESGINNKKCHDIKYVKDFITNKQDFVKETGEYNKRCYSPCGEGLI